MMRRYLLLVLIAQGAFFSLSVHGQASGSASQEAAPAVSSSVREIDKLKVQVVANPSDEAAWLNYFKTVRTSAMMGRSRAIDPTHYREMEVILSSMSDHIEGTYSWHLAHYLFGGKSDLSWHHLREAARIRPQSTELLAELVSMHTIQGEYGEASRLAKSMVDKKLFSQAELEYNRNVLNSLEKNSLLITYGFADTYPLLALQASEGLRKDVKLICLEWVGSARYLREVEKLTGISLKGKEGMEFDVLSAVLRASGVPVYVGLTLPPDELRRWSSTMYCTGLALKVSKEPLVNLESLRQNWETFFSTNHLFEEEPLNRNYLIPLAQLYAYYNAQSLTDNAAEVKRMALVIAGKAGQRTLVESYFR